MEVFLFATKTIYVRVVVDEKVRLNELDFLTKILCQETSIAHRL